MTLAVLLACALAPAPSRAQSEATASPETAAHATAPASATPADAPPADLRDLEAWLDYRVRHHIASLPQEARLYYRRGLVAHEAGAGDQAVRYLRGAAELDPTFVAPHLTLASWTLLSEPGQALVQYANVIELARRNFTLQHALLANVLYLGLQSIFLGLFAAAFVLAVVHAREIHHVVHERLSGWLRADTSRWWAWAVVVLPYFAGLGPVLPTLFILGWLWHELRPRERFVFVVLTLACVASPFVAIGLDRLVTPLNEGRGPFYGVTMVENEPYSEAREARLRQLVREHEDNPYLHFGLAWTARRGGHLPLAEAEYRRALELRPQDDRILNNLGNLLAAQGRAGDALPLYEKAQKINPANAAAFFNASQIYTQRFDYKPASDALTRASALDFELVRTYQSQGTDDGGLALADQWLAPETFWSAIGEVRASGDPSRALPPWWRVRIEGAGWPFAVAALLLAIGGLVVGRRMHQLLPLRRCSNCDAVLCRRCAQRRREIALCSACAAVESRAESPEFARVLLLQHRRRVEGRTHLLRTTFATLVPGVGLLSFGRVFGATFLLTLVSTLVAGWIGFRAPFAYEPRLALADSLLPLPVLAALWAFVYLVSITGYFHRLGRKRAQEAMLQAPTRSRAVQASRHVPSAAA